MMYAECTAETSKKECTKVKEDRASVGYELSSPQALFEQRNGLITFEWLTIQQQALFVPATKTQGTQQAHRRSEKARVIG